MSENQRCCPSSEWPPRPALASVPGEESQVLCTCHSDARTAPGSQQPVLFLEQFTEDSSLLSFSFIPPHFLP